MSRERVAVVSRREKGWGFPHTSFKRRIFAFRSGVTCPRREIMSSALPKSMTRKRVR